MTKHVVNDKLVDMNEAEQKAYDERSAENERLAVPRALVLVANKGVSKEEGG